MNKTVHNAATLDPRISRGLRALGGGIRLRLFLRGLGWVLLAVLGAGAISFVLDYGLYRLTLQHLTGLQRLVINGFCLAGVVVVGIRHLVRPVAKTFAHRDLALVIEKEHAELNDRLLSAMQFADPGCRPTGDVSPELMDAVIGDANAAVAPIDFSAALRGDAVRRVLGKALAVLAVAAGLIAWQWEIARPWLLRTLLLQSTDYPKRTALRVEGGNPLRVVRGGVLTVVIRADRARVVPDSVTYHMRFPSLGDLVQTVRASADDSSRFDKVFPSVTEPFTFYVTGNDDRTGRIRVELVEPPALSDVRFVITPPTHTLRPPTDVHATEGALNVPEGSRVQLEGRSTKDLSTAAIFVDDEPVGECVVVKEPGADASRTIRGDLYIPTPEPFRPRLNLRIVLEDTRGFVNQSAAAFHVLLIRDAPPTVHLEELGMGGQISRVARIPLLATARDDYGIEEMQLEWSLQSMPLNVQTNDAKLYNPPVPKPPPLRGLFDLQTIRAMATSNTPPLAVGETIRIQISARDSLPANVGTNRVLSNLVTFRIVPDDEVLASLVDAQRVMRERLRQIIALQMEVRDRTQTAIDNSSRGTTLGLARHEVVKCADSEHQVRDQLGATTERLEQLLARIRNNRIVAETDERRMQRSIIATLKSAGDEYVAVLVKEFDAAKAITGGEDLAARLQDLVQIQDDLIKLLEGVVAEMIRMENAQQVERGLRTIIKLSDKVRGMMKTRTRPPEKKAPGKEEAKKE